MDELVKLYDAGSKVILSNGKVIEGANEIGRYVYEVIEISVVHGYKKGLKAGFVGGVIGCGIGVLVYNKYRSKQKFIWNEVRE